MPDGETISTSNETETVTISSDDPEKIRNLEKIIKEKEAEIKKLKNQPKENLGTRNSVVNGPGFSNGYANGKVKKAIAEIRKKQEISKRGSVQK